MPLPTRSGTRVLGGTTVLDRPGVRDWIIDHDGRWLFVVAYLGLSVGLSIFVSLFWLLVVVGLHFLLECVRQSHTWRRRRDVTLHALWEVKLDIGLAVLAFTLVLYIDVALGLLGIQAASRAAGATRVGVRVASRAAAWERNIRSFLLTVDEMARIGHAAFIMRGRGRRAKPAVAATPEPEPAAAAGLVPAWQARWGHADRIGLLLVASGLLLILLAPFLTSHDWASAAAALREQLRPFPS